MDIKCVGVIGLGAMGTGIAQVCAQSGYSVVAVDINQKLVDKGIASITSFLSKSVEKGKITQAAKDETLGRIKYVTDTNSLKDCDLVIESIIENLEAKIKVFEQLGKICRKECILATNTSVLSVIDMAAATGKPDKVLGMHFFNPVPLMKTVELVRTIVTSDETMDTAKKFAESLNKIIIEARDTPGFIVDRLSIAFSLNAVRALEAGVGTIEEIDKAISLSLNHPMGPFRLMDLIGIDNLASVSSSLYKQLGDPQYFTPVTVQKMIAAGWLGQKAGRGFYDYSSSK